MLGLTCREPVNTATTILALSHWSIYKSQRCTKGSAQWNGSMVISRPDYNQMEVYWIPIMDPRKTCVSVMIDGKWLLTNPNYLSGLQEKCHLVHFSLPASAQNLLFSSSSIIHHIMAGSVIITYFYFNFKDVRKQTCHDLLLSLVSQLSTHSSAGCSILRIVYKAHSNGTWQPTDNTLKECLKQMLRLPRQPPIFIVLDVLDKCPDSPGLPPPRSEVLQFVKELVNLRLRRLHICATSHPEVDIRAILEPLAFRSVSLHNESRQQSDIARYIQSVINLSWSTAMRRWRECHRSVRDACL